MCYLCVEWEKGKMTDEEVFNALGEMFDTELDSEEDREKINHLFELSNKILEKEVPFKNWDSDTDMDSLDNLEEGSGEY